MVFSFCLAPLLLALFALSDAARPAYDGFNKTNFVCNKPVDCPVGFSCFDPESLLEVVTQEGYCDCYVTVGATGDDCQGRESFNATWFAGTALIVGLFTCFMLGVS